MKKIYRQRSETVVQAALDFANLHHRYVPRKETGTPYIIHPLQVVDRMGRWGIHPNEHPELWAAGLLHDVDEDTAATLAEIECLFGQTVAYYVSELTFRDRLPDEKASQYTQAKDEYLASFASKSVGALVVKIADRLCNVEDFLWSDKRYAVKYFDKAKPLFDAHSAKDQVGDIDAILGKEVAENIVWDIGQVANRIDRQRRD